MDTTRAMDGSRYVGCNRESNLYFICTERRIPPRNSIYSIGSTLQLVARQKPCGSGNKNIAQSKPLNTDTDSIRLLYKELRAKQEELQSLRYTRISKGLPVNCNPDGLQSIASLNCTLDKLCKQNEERGECQSYCS